MKKNVAFLGVFLALGLVFSYVESLFPFFFGVPGMKLGLSNSLVLSLIFIVGAKEAFTINILRIILSGLAFGNPFSIVYSLAGAVLSFIVMVLLKKTGKLSVISISVAGGIAHNLGQILIAMLILNTVTLGYYFSVLLISGFVSGVLIGIISIELIKRIGV